MKLFEAAGSKANYNKPIEQHYDHLPPKERIQSILTSIGYVDKWSFVDENDTDPNPLIDLQGNIDVQHSKLKELPIRIYSITGNFTWIKGNLHSLKGTPAIVGGNFIITANKLESLEGGPSQVGSSYECSGNRLKNLKGAPDECDGSFIASSNDLTSMEGAPKVVGGKFSVSGNYLENFDHAPSRMQTFLAKDNRFRSVVGISKIIKECEAIYLTGNHIIEGGIEALNIEKIEYFALDNENVSDILEKHFKHWGGGGPADIFDCQAELIEQGFEEYTKL